MRLFYKTVSAFASFGLVVTLLNSVDNKGLNGSPGSVPRSPANRAISFVFDEYRKLYEEWKGCAHSILNPLRYEVSKLWFYSASLALECGTPLLKKLNVKQFSKKNEIKYHIRPTNGKTTVVTLGIGHDVDAETEMRQALGVNMSEFFGTDPIVEMNKELYSSIGKFFPFAVSSEAGDGIVLDENTYKKEQRTYIEMTDFFKNHVQRHLIDQLLVDVAGAEFGLFPYFYKHGRFEINEIVICQINIEIHAHNYEEERLLHEFIFQLLNEERYAITEIVKSPLVPWHFGKTRLFLLNMENPQCIHKYTMI